MEVQGEKDSGTREALEKVDGFLATSVTVVLVGLC